MGIIIQVDTEAIEKRPMPLSQLPLPILMTLECDAATDIFCRGFAKYSHGDGFVGCHAAAMADGWLERHAAGGRLWLCPRCSGKKSG